LLLFAKHSLNLISQEIVNRHALSHVLVQVTTNATLVASEACTSDRPSVNRNPDSDSCPCERSLNCGYCRTHSKHCTGRSTTNELARHNQQRPATDGTQLTESRGDSS